MQGLATASLKSARKVAGVRAQRGHASLNNVRWAVVTGGTRIVAGRVPKKTQRNKRENSKSEACQSTRSDERIGPLEYLKQDQKVKHKNATRTSHYYTLELQNTSKEISSVERNVRRAVIARRACIVARRARRAVVATWASFATRLRSHVLILAAGA
jgi:hypothetical protein